MIAPSPACVGEPLSWLVLERYALGELPAPEASRVSAHLAICAACTACGNEARQPLPWARVAVERAPRRWWRRYAASWMVTATLAGAAAAFLLMARTPERAGPSPLAGGGTLPGVKGGDVALELVRERQGTITHDAASFAAGDHWKVLVTCPASRVLFWDVVVRDGDAHDARHPLMPTSPIACGNHVALPGAFRLAGIQPAEVCVSLSSDPLPHAAPAGRNLCVTVQPEK